MTAVQFRPAKPTANFREPTTVLVELDDGLSGDDWSVDSPTAGLAEVAQLGQTGRPGSRLLVVDLRKTKAAPDPGEHRITILIRRNQVLHATVDVPLRIVEKRRCLAIAGAVPKFIVNADGSVTLRITIFNRCGASASLDLRASVGRKGIGIHAPAVSIGPGEFGIIDPKLTFDTGDFADLVTQRKLPNDFGLSISTKGSVGGEIRLTAKDFVETFSAPPPPPTLQLGHVVPAATPGPRRSSVFAKAGAAAVGVAGLVGLIWVGSQLLSDSDQGASDVATTVAPTSTEAPVDTEAPTETDAPVDTEVPVETDAPEETNPPTETTDPARIRRGTIDPGDANVEHIDGRTFSLSADVPVVLDFEFDHHIQLLVGRERVFEPECDMEGHHAFEWSSSADRTATVTVDTVVLPEPHTEGVILVHYLLCDEEAVVLDRHVSDVELRIPRIDIVRAEWNGLYVVDDETARLELGSSDPVGVEIEIAADFLDDSDTVQFELVAVGLDSIENCVTPEPEDLPQFEDVDTVLLEEAHLSSGGLWEMEAQWAQPTCQKEAKVDVELRARAGETGAWSDPHALLELHIVPDPYYSLD